jgi:hypothetical protein
MPDWTPPQSTPLAYLPCEALAEILKEPSVKRPTSKCYNFGNDSLGSKLVHSSLQHLHCSPTWASYVATIRGPSHLSLTSKAFPILPPNISSPSVIMHASHHRYHWMVRRGLRCTPLQRGSHTSTHDHIDFVRDKMADFGCPKRFLDGASV